MGNITNPQQLGVRQQLGASGGAFIDVSNSVLNVNIGDGLTGDGSNKIITQGDAIADGFLSEGTDSHQISVNVGNGLEDDGSNNLRIDPGAILGNGLVEDTPSTIGIATDGVSVDELDTTTSYSFTANQEVSISEPGTGATDVLSLTDSSSGDALKFMLTSSGEFSIRASDSSAATTRNLINIDPSQDRVVYGSNIIPSSVGSFDVGTSSDYFNEMHATNFITHSPEPRTYTEAWVSINEYEGGSMQIEEKLADVMEVVKEQKKTIENQVKRIEELEEKI